MKRLFAFITLILFIASTYQRGYITETPKKDRFDFIKGWCIGTNVDCPLDSVEKCWTDNSAREDLNLAYDWMMEIVGHPSHKVAEVNKYFIKKMLPIYFELISQETIQCDVNSRDFHMLRDKIGVNLWSEEWLNNMITFATNKPEQFYSFMNSALYFFEKRDFEAAGAILGLKNEVMMDVDKDRSFEKSTEL